MNYVLIVKRETGSEIMPYFLIRTEMILPCTMAGGLRTSAHYLAGALIRVWKPKGRGRKSISPISRQEEK